MSALGLARREVANCRLLAWMLDPNAWHGVGTACLEALAERFGLDPVGLGGAVVRTEVHQVDQEFGASRADIVIETARSQVIIEAKVDHFESERQTLKLEAHWPDATSFVLLTLGRADPSGQPACDWKSVSWSEFAAVGRQALDEAPEAGGRVAGAREAVGAWLTSAERNLTVQEISVEHFSPAQRFYFRNQDALRRLSEPADTIPRHVHELLKAHLPAALAEAAGDRQLEYVYVSRARVTWRYHLLVPVSLEERERPLIGFGVGLDKQDVGVGAGLRRGRVWVGLRIDVDRPTGRQIREVLIDDEARQLRTDTGFDQGTNERWPLSRYVDFPEGWWDAPQKLFDSIERNVGDLLEGWHDQTMDALQEVGVEAS